MKHHNEPISLESYRSHSLPPSRGNWHSLAKLETELAKFASEAELTLNIRRTEPRPPRTELPYTIDAVCLDQTGVVSALAGFCSQRGIDIAEVSTHAYVAAHTGAQMFSVQMSAFPRASISRTFARNSSISATLATSMPSSTR